MARKNNAIVDSDFDIGSELATLLGGVESKRLAPIMNPHDFVFKYCYTLDPHDSTSPIKLMPNKEHLHRLIDIWLDEQLLVIGKSRQMQISWLFVALHLWDALVHHGRVQFFVSRKEGDAGLDSPLSLLSRAQFIYERLPKNVTTPVRKSLQPPIFRFPRMNSVIQAMSQDSDALRTYTASCILCIAPETKVLTANLKWVTADAVKRGDTLAGFDEEINRSVSTVRNWQNATVRNVIKNIKPCWQLTLSDGTKVICSENHKWLSGHSQGWHWVSTRNLRPLTSKQKGQGRGGSKIVKLVEVWDMDKSYSAGYLAAAYDGEGCFSQEFIPERNGHFVRLLFSQNENLMLSKVVKFLTAKGFEFKVYKTSDAGTVRGDFKSNFPHYRIYFKKRAEIMRFLGQIRPKRLLPKLDLNMWGKVVASRGVELLEKKFIGNHEVVSIATDTKTFVAEGLASHNCDEWAFQEKAEISYSAMKPTLDGGGKLTGVSSPNGKGNLFYRLLHDQLNTKRRYRA